MQHITDEMAEVAAGWWTNKIDGFHIHDNGDISQASQLACGLADILMKPVSNELAENFKQHLKKKLLEVDMENEFSRFWLGVDYSPCRILKEAADEVGVDENNFPFKTDMFIEMHRIVVSAGYGMPPEVIYKETQIA